MAALLVALSSLVSRFLGIFRDRILASQFGAGDTLDIYYAAFRIPDLIFNLLVLGALSAGFIPIFTCLIKDPKCKLRALFTGSPNQEAWDLANNMLNLLMILLVALSAIGIIFSPIITKLITPGFSSDKQLMTSFLSRIMFLSPIFLGISSIFGGILQSFKRFFVYSLSPIFYNVGIILGALFFVPILGVYGLAWGVVLGAFMHLIVQVPTVFALGYRYRPIFNIKNSNIKKISIMMVARTMSLATSQINLVVITIVASTLASGSLAIFNFANNLQSFPVGIFAISFAVAAFPAMSAIAFDKKKLVDSFSSVTRQILFFIIPASVLLFTLRAQIIRVILGTGQFNWEDTILTINTLSFFIVSLFAQAILPLLVRVFYARHNSSTPFFIGLFCGLLNVLLSVYLSRKFGVVGLALAFSLASIINLLLLWIILRKEIGGLDEKRIFISTLKFSIAALVCGISIQGMKLLVWPYIDMTKVWGVLTQGLSAGVIGLLAYIVFCSLMNSEELLYFWSSIKKRLSWKKIETGDQGEARGI
jgi:putative peptidoglycan lipid II flippase